MRDYSKEYGEFSFPVPERFSFPLDVFDRWDEGLALFWTDGTSEKKLSFKDLTTLSAKGAAALLKAGIRKGDKVLVMLPNIPEWWEIVLALMRLNAIPIPATPLMSTKDVEYRLSVADIKAIITTTDEAEKVEAALQSGTWDEFRPLPLRIVVGSHQPWLDYRAAREISSPYYGERDPSHEASLLYFTSGTTGPPKMVLHSHASYPLAHRTTGSYWLDLRPGDVHWNLSDTGWAKAAWSSLFGPWHMGATVFSFYRPGKFDPALAVEILRRYPITTFCGPPTAYRMIVKEATSPEQYRFHSLRHCVAAGEPLNSEIITVWRERTGLTIYDGYGQTETTIVIGNFRCLPVKPGSMGVAVPGFVVDVIDEKGTPCLPGVEGDIALRVKPARPVGLFREYLWNRAATEHTLRDGWYVTGDRARKDEDGYFWFIGRADDILLTSGYRIGPFEIESILIEHPAVRESAVVPSPDEVRGEVVKAFVVLTSGYTPGEALAREIQEFVKKRTAPYKYPRKVEFVEELPKTISGKIRRKELRLREFGR
jgi:acetyl-CoA synthetase/medium-chain acyl-CoA synthetase